MRWYAFLLFVVAPCTAAQGHLVPELWLPPRAESYQAMLNHVFAAGFEDDVHLRAVVLPSFGNEHLAGLRRDARSSHLFTLRSTTKISNILLLESYEKGEYKLIGADGNPVPLEENELYLHLAGTTPRDYREITAKLEQSEIPSDLSHELILLWRDMLIETRFPKEEHWGLDGTMFHFEMLAGERRTIGGKIWSPNPGTRTAAFVSVLQAMIGVAEGKIPVALLRSAVDFARSRNAP